MTLLSSVWEASWRIGMFFLLWAFLFAPLAAPITKRWERTGGISPWSRLYLEFVALATIVLSAWILLSFVDRRPFSTLGFSTDRLWHEAAMGVAVGATLFLLALALLGLGGWVRAHSPVFVWHRFVPISLALLCNSVFQEVMFRGYVLQTIQTHLGTSGALLLSSGVFALFHSGTARGGLALLNLFLAGSLFGYAYLATGGLWAPIALHFVWNFLEGPVFGLPGLPEDLKGGTRFLRLQGPEWITGGTFGFEGSVIVTFTLAVGLIGLYGLYG